MKSFVVSLIVVILIGSAFGALTTKQLEQLKRIEEGYYEDTDSQIHKEMFEDIREFYSKAANIIEELKKTNPDQLEGEFLKSLEFLAPILPFLEQFDPENEWGKKYIELFKIVVEKIQFILQENIKFAKGKPYNDWSVETIIKPIEQLLEEHKQYLLDVMLKDENLLKESVPIALQFGKTFLDFVDEMEPNNELNQIFVESVTLLFLKVNAYLTLTKNTLKI